jgi:cell division protein FtsZ
LLDVTIDGARGILFNVTGGPSMSLYDVNQAAAIIRETAHPDANMIFGAVIDESMGDKMRITVIATGFDRGLTRRQVLQQQYGRSTSTPSSAPQQYTPPTAPPQRETVDAHVQREAEPVQPKFTPNNLEIPAFLRRR